MPNPFGDTAVDESVATIPRSPFGDTPRTTRSGKSPFGDTPRSPAQKLGLTQQFMQGVRSGWQNVGQPAVNAMTAIPRLAGGLVPPSVKQAFQASVNPLQQFFQGDPGMGVPPAPSRTQQLLEGQPVLGPNFGLLPPSLEPPQVIAPGRQPGLPSPTGAQAVLGAPLAAANQLATGLTSPESAAMIMAFGPEAAFIPQVRAALPVVRSAILGQMAVEAPGAIRGEFQEAKREGGGLGDYVKATLNSAVEAGIPILGGYGETMRQLRPKEIGPKPTSLEYPSGVTTREMLPQFTRPPQTPRGPFVVSPSGQVVALSDLSPAEQTELLRGPRVARDRPGTGVAQPPEVGGFQYPVSPEEIVLRLRQPKLVQPGEGQQPQEVQQAAQVPLPPGTSPLAPIYPTQKETYQLGPKPPEPLGPPPIRRVEPPTLPGQELIGRAMTINDLRPGIVLDNGRKLIGEVGEVHDEILERNGENPAKYDHFHPGRGFFLPDGTFVSRVDAAKIAGVEGTAEAGGLDSMDLPNARELRANRLQRLRDIKKAQSRVSQELTREKERTPDAIRELRPGLVPETQPPGDIQKVEEEVRRGAETQRNAPPQGEEGKAPGVLIPPWATEELQTKLHMAWLRAGGRVNITDIWDELTTEQKQALRDLKWRVMEGKTKEGKPTGNVFLLAPKIEDMPPGIKPVEPPPQRPRERPPVPPENIIEPSSDWFYRRDLNEIFWNVRPTQEMMRSAEGFLQRQGINDPKHRIDPNTPPPREGGETRLYSFGPIVSLEEIKKLGEKFTGGQLIGFLRNRVPEEYEALKAAGIEEFAKKGRMTQGEVQKWLQENAPRVEVKKLAATASTEHQQELANLQHWLETNLSQGLKNELESMSIQEEVYGVPSKEALLERGFTEEQATKIMRVQQLSDEAGEPRTESATSRFQEANPKPLDSMPGAVDLLVRIPTEAVTQRHEAMSGVKYKSTHYPTEGKNLIAHIRGYMETLAGKKIFHVFEAQSDWANAIRKSLKRLETPISEGGYGLTREQAREPETRALRLRNTSLMEEPLLKHYETLAIKAAIDHARAEGATHIAISDYLTAALSEGWDRAQQAARDFADRLNRPAAKADMDYSTADRRLGAFQRAYGEFGAKAHLEGERLVLDKLPFEGRGRLLYDQLLPRIAKELTGDEGQKVNFGKHKNSFSVMRGKKVFRPGDHSDVTARMFDISKARETFSLFGSDRPLPTAKLYGGIPFFDPDMWGVSKEDAERMEMKYIAHLQKTDPEAAEARRQTRTPNQFIPATERERNIISNTRANPFRTRGKVIPQPGRTLSFTEDAALTIRNFRNQMFDLINKSDKWLFPANAMYDLLGGRDPKGIYKNPLMENIKKPIDTAYQNEVALTERLLKPIVAVAKGLDKAASDRIGIYLNTLQEGGTKRMLASGITQESIDNAVKNLTPQERRVAGAIRVVYDALGPLIKETAKKVDNLDITLLPNYFTWAREWDKYQPPPDELATATQKQNMTPDDVLWPGLEPEVSGRVIPGSFLERVKGARTPISVDAFSIVDRYIRDASHYIAMRGLLKDISKTVRKDEFAKVYGNFGQELVMDHLNAVARQGRYHKEPFLDALRKLVSVGVIAYRIPSQLVHAANIPLAMARVTPYWWNLGAEQTFTKRGHEFLLNNFGEVFQRSGGERALAELEEGRIGQPTKWQTFRKYGFIGQRWLDEKNTSATILGHYMRELNRKGQNPLEYDTLPIDREAASQAIVIAQRAVASPLYKDIPIGMLKGGSLARAFFQFQNTFLDQWSNIRHDLINNGIDPALWEVGKRADYAKNAMYLTIAVGAMLGVESAIKYGYKSGLAWATGGQLKEDDSFYKQLAHEALRRVPGMGQLMVAIQYGESGIPSLDVAASPLREAYKAATAEEQSSRETAEMRAGTSALELTGFPGASQLGDIAQALQRAKLFKPHEKKLLQQEGKRPEEMGLEERVLAEQRLKRERGQLERMDEARAAARAVVNIQKRGAEVEKMFSSEDQAWMNARELRLPGFDNKISLGGTRVYLTKEEMKGFEKLVAEEQKVTLDALKKYKRLNEFDALPFDKRKESFNAMMNEAVRRARGRFLEDYQRRAQESGGTRRGRYSVLQP